MAFAVSNQPENRTALLSNAVFYVALLSVVIAAVCYGIFTFKIYLEHKQLGVLQTELLASGTPEQKAQEQTVLDDKKNIDNFALLINSHRSSINLFNFIEANTLPSVWYSSLNVSETQDQLSLAGEADTMDTLSHQVQIFENNPDYIQGISVLSSSVQQDGRVSFTLKLSLDPRIFLSYVAPAPATAATPTSPPANPAAPASQ